MNDCKCLMHERTSAECTCMCQHDGTDPCDQPRCTEAGLAVGGAEGEREFDVADSLYHSGHNGYARRTWVRAHALLWAAGWLGRESLSTPRPTVSG